ncbi:hypothetical protein ACP70R_037485 [Stipagrostis hirtigluma subsp. patula]
MSAQAASSSRTIASHPGRVGYARFYCDIMDAQSDGDTLAIGSFAPSGPRGARARAPRPHNDHEL